MISVATAFYLEDKSKVQIAADLGLTRFKVARILKQAHRLGIVKIDIGDPFGTTSQITTNLQRALSLEQVVLVPGNSSYAADCDTLARIASAHLAALVKEDMAIGVSWGRTLAGLGARLEGLPPVDLVQLTGMVGTDPTESPLQIMASLSRSSRLRPHALVAPLFASSKSAANRLREEPHVQNVLDRYDSLDIAVLSIGAWRGRITQLEQHLSPLECAMLDEAGAIADCAGLFFDADGHEITNQLTERRISITAKQLRRTPTTIAIAGGKDKAAAILATARSGILNTLVTTTQTAIAIMELVSATQD